MINLITVKLLWADRIIQAICWMLVHSLWLGLMLAVVAAIILLYTRKASAATRYNLLTLASVVFLLCIGYIFCRQWSVNPGNNHTGSLAAGSTTASLNINADDPGTLATSFLQNCIHFLNHNATFIVLVWLAIMAFRSIRLAEGYYTIYRMKRNGLIEPGEYWKDRVAELSFDLGVQWPVRFFQSGMAKVPLVLGCFKPVILFPVGLLASIPPDEVEAILLHELAHIRRNDYLVNLLQHVIESCFFFNPAILWVSSLMRRERENCCDDIAVSKSGSKRSYVQALLSFQEYQLAHGDCAVAFPGPKYPLLHRVRRIVYNNNKTLNAMEKFFLASGLVVTGLCALAFSSPTRNGVKKATPAIDAPRTQRALRVSEIPRLAVMKSASDTVPEKNNKGKSFSTEWSGGSQNCTISTMFDGKRYELTLKNDKITELTIDGRKIPDDKIANYDVQTKQIIQEAKENWAREVEAAKKAQELDLLKMKLEMSQQKEEMEKYKAEAILEQKAKLEELRSEEAMMRKEISEQKRQMDKRRTEELSDNPEALRKLDEQLRELRERSIRQETELAMRQNSAYRRQAENAQVEAVRLKAEAETYIQLAKEYQEQANRSMEQAKKAELDAKKTADGIVDDLISEKVITSKKGLSVSLNKDELIVNGVKQPAALHKKFMEKYFKGRDGNLNYNFND